VKKPKENKFRPFLKRFAYAFLLATILVLISPTSEKDTGNRPQHIDIDFVSQKPPEYQKFVRYLKSQGYEIIQNNLPLFIEVSIKQTDRNPGDVVKELSRRGCQITGHKVKVILSTFGGKYISEEC